MNVIEQVRQHIAETGATQTRIAKEAGLSAGALSAYLSESYKGNIEEVEAKLTAYFERLAQKLREFIEAPSFIETKTATQIFSTLRFAQNANVLAIIHGASGVGKTQAAREYRRRYNNVWVVTASPSRSSLSEILYEIALEVGISDAPRRKGTLSRLIARKIKGTEGLLIVDEADHLPYEALEELRLLQEEITNESDIGSFSQVISNFFYLKNP
ncbi:DNA transposition protein [Canicola haemoglobinophilus]|uniref:DNA transposition protein n=1 Tax=Canicola haemoglobinophilus TaxID=733 RepID=A0AB38HBU7_9PAST|nr:DNA transposition protein [Canicola haemoglobinophilus]STO69655.1 DNA transposition protein [Canicola haemoglobinophilus]